MNKNIGDMSKEELYDLCNELLDKDTDYMLIQRRIDKAIEYIKNKTTNERYGNLIGDEWYKKELHLSREELKDLLEILGDKK